MARYILYYDSFIITILAQRETRKVFFAINKFFSHLGNGVFYVLIGLLELWLFGNKGWLMFLAILIGYAIQLPVYVIVKNSVKRLRPFEKLENIQNIVAVPDKYSFPSGHTAAAFLMARSLSFQFPELSLFLFVIAALIGFSRVFLRVHYPTDVMAGAALGLLSSWVGTWIVFS